MIEVVPGSHAKCVCKNPNVIWVKTEDNRYYFCLNCRVGFYLEPKLPGMKQRQTLTKRFASENEFIDLILQRKRGQDND